MCYGAAGWEAAHLKVRNAVYDYIAETNIYIRIKVSMYLGNTEITSLTTGYRCGAHGSNSSVR